jgi:hypothetical protein
MTVEEALTRKKRGQGPPRTPERMVWHKVKRDAVERWRDFEKFLADVAPKPGPGYFLVRLDSRKPFSKSNANWVTRKEFYANRGNKISFRGKAMRLVEWARNLEIPYQTLMSRLYRMPIEVAMTANKLRRGRKRKARQ